MTSIANRSKRKRSSSPGLPSDFAIDEPVPQRLVSEYLLLRPLELKGHALVPHLHGHVREYTYVHEARRVARTQLQIQSVSPT